AALERLRDDLPFPMLGLDSDNGSEFINRTLICYCTDTGVTFTRGRPFNKNDGCHVEQKNWAVVRRLVGYARLEPLALPALERLHALTRDYVNFLHPVRKLISRQRIGARIVRRYDRAQTPYRRLLASNALSEVRVDELATAYLALDPVRLKRDIEAAQATLRRRAAPLGAKARWVTQPAPAPRSDSSVRQPCPVG
ncbi:MAG: transposase, partial [Chloroflexi bacterium]|nr:transposase [Chloroflexota bacterium]